MFGKVRLSPLTKKVAINEVGGFEATLDVDYRLVHVVRDFRPWDIVMKIRYFLMVQIYK